VPVTSTGIAGCPAKVSCIAPVSVTRPAGVPSTMRGACCSEIDTKPP
jgi:hypothetical protein